MSQTFLSWAELSLSVVQGLRITASSLGLGYYLMVSGETIETVLLLLMILAIPSIQSVFEFESVRIALIGMALAVSFLGLFWIEVLKAGRRRN